MLRARDRPADCSGCLDRALTIMADRLAVFRLCVQVDDCPSRCRRPRPPSVIKENASGVISDLP
eukprot:5767795-Prymnesium_polylepis.1